jgi:cell division inhibitor SepF
MGILDKFKDLVGIELEDEDEEEVVEEEKKVRPVREERVREERIREDRKPAASSPRMETVARTEVTRQTMGGNKYTSQFKMVVIEPNGFEECPKLVDSLKAKKPVIINLENLETDVARKIFDFLSGATYALNGNVQKVTNNIFVFAPENVDVTYKDSTKQVAAPESSRSMWR